MVKLVSRETFLSSLKNYAKISIYLLQSAWRLSILGWYHPYLKGMRQGATRRVARRYKTLKRRYTAIEAAAELARSPANGAINGSGRSWWRRVFEGRARARGGA